MQPKSASIHRAEIRRVPIQVVLPLKPLLSHCSLHEEAEMRIPCGTIPALAALALMTTSLSAQQPAPPAPNDDAVVQPATAQDAAPVHSNSKVRIVRLSEVKGELKLDRNTGQGFESAIQNIPIIEGARLQTATGAAEVEFEDNSTVRVGPDSLVEFPQLELTPAGTKLSTIAVQKGMAYVSLLNTKDEFTVTFGQQKIHLQPNSHIRLQVYPDEARLAVFDGSAKVEGPSGTTEAAKKKTLVFNLANTNAPVVAKNTEPDPFDSWDHDSADYHKKYVAHSAMAGSPYSYGASDMTYYGSFVNAGGCGNMWQPYFASAGWSPFANGVWAYYPGAGYSWVSPYPWGWTPFHSGNWISCPGMGWGWLPGSSWTGLGNYPTALNTGGQTIQPVKPPTRIAGGKSLVVVNSSPMTESTFKDSNFTFRKDSAGFGVPRGSLGKLDGFAKDTMHHGAANTPVYAETSPANQSGSRAAQAGLTQVPRAGSPPPYQQGESMARSAAGGQTGYSQGSTASASSGVRTAGTSGGSAAPSGGGRPR
jgi:FecR protein